MLRLLGSLLPTLRSALRTRTDLALENLALRQQLAALRRQVGRPQVRFADRLFWAWLHRFWGRWREALILVQPETVIRWHRRGFIRFWAWRSRRRGLGRPRIDRKVKELIERVRPRTRSGVHPACMPSCSSSGSRAHGGPCPGGRRVVRSHRHRRSFLDNHVKDLVSVDFFTVPTASFQVLFGFLVLAHDRRRVVHFNVTANPTAHWTAQQVVDAFPWESAPRYLLRDRDSIFGGLFRSRVRGMSIEEVLIAYRSPWQNPFAERLIGSIRRECLDHVIVLGEKHLNRVLGEYFRYYHRSRTHLWLEKDCPEPRAVQPPGVGEVVEFPEVGGLHHRYERRAA